MDLTHHCPCLPTASLLQSLLRFVCDTAQRQGDAQFAGRAFLPFYAVLTCELLDKVPAVDEPLTRCACWDFVAGPLGWHNDGCTASCGTSFAFANIAYPYLLFANLSHNSMLLPYMLAGVRSSAVADYRSATYMVIGQLASKAIFSDHLLSGVQVAVIAARRAHAPSGCRRGVPAHEGLACVWLCALLCISAVHGLLHLPMMQTY